MGKEGRENEDDLTGGEMLECGLTGASSKMTTSLSGEDPLVCVKDCLACPFAFRLELLLGPACDATIGLSRLGIMCGKVAPLATW